MGVISVSLPSDGSTADVADVNTPITTIVNAINGGLDSANLTDNAVTAAKLAALSVTVSKMNLTATTYTNPGTAGGTFYYMTLGAVKVFWGQSSAQGIGTGGANFTITLPVGLFTTVQAPIYSVAATTTDQNQYVVGVNQSSTTLTYFAHSGTNGSTQTTAILVLGT